MPSRKSTSFGVLRRRGAAAVSAVLATIVLAVVVVVAGASADASSRNDQGHGLAGVAEVPARLATIGVCAGMARPTRVTLTEMAVPGTSSHHAPLRVTLHGSAEVLGLFRSLCLNKGRVCHAVFGEDAIYPVVYVATFAAGRRVVLTASGYPGWPCSSLRFHRGHARYAEVDGPLGPGWTGRDDQAKSFFGCWASTRHETFQRLLASAKLFF